MPTQIAKVTVNRLPEAEPGKDAVMYEIVVTPDAWCLNPDGTCPLTSVDKYPRIKVYKIEGSERTDVSGCWVMQAGLMIPPDFALKVYADDKDISSAVIYNAEYGYIVRPYDIRLNGYKSMRFEFYSHAGGFIGTGVLEDSKSIAIAQSGLPGKVRAPMRITDWDADPVGMEFYPGDGDDDPWTDIVYQVSGGQPVFYQCLQKCTKASGDQPDTKKLNESACFRAATNFQFVATDLLLAVEAVIKNLIAEKVVAGDKDGNRIEILPTDKAIYIYDENKNKCAEFSGRIKSVDSVLMSSAKWTGLPSDKSQTQTGTGTSRDYDSGWVRSGSISSSEGGTTYLYCNLYAYAGNAYWVKAASTMEMDYFKNANVRVSVRIVNAGRTQVYDSAQVDAASKGYMGTIGTVGNQQATGPINGSSDTKETSVRLMANLAKGATAYLEYRIEIWYTPSSDTTHQIIATAKISGVTATATTTPIYRADHFGNGMIISATNNDYMMCVYEEGKGFHFAAVSEGRGVRVSPAGLALKTSSASEWQNIKVENGYLKTE